MALSKRWEVKEIFISLDDGAERAQALASGKDLVLEVSKKGLRQEIEQWAPTIKAGVFEATLTSPELDGQLESAAREAYIVAISYNSSDQTPGLWLDAFPEAPTAIQALRACFDEFRETGELVDTSFEEFLRLASPNVVVISPQEIEGYVSAKLVREAIAYTSLKTAQEQSAAFVAFSKAESDKKLEKENELEADSQSDPVEPDEKPSESA